MAAQAKTKTAQNGAGKKPKAQLSAPSTGTSTPVTTTAPALPAEQAAYGHGKPDKSVYDAEQEKIKGEIEQTQQKLVSIPSCTRPPVVFASSKLAIYDS